jgi:hypothetical protein
MSHSLEPYPGMSNILQFLKPNVTFDPDTLLILGDVYDRACTRLCTGPLDSVCEVMASRIISAAMKGERDPGKLWEIAVRPI